MSVLEIDSVIKSYGAKQVLTDIYLKCETGNIIGMLGRNGAGKSTLLQILFGTLQTDRKFIRIDGKVKAKLYTEHNEICYLPQDTFLPHTLTVEKIANLYFNTDKASQFLEEPMLERIKKIKTGLLSGGELRYLELKLLFETSCKFLLLDEPFNGLSPVMVDQVKQMIVKASASKGIILTDHDYRNVLDIANKYCLVRDGGIKEIRNREDLIKWDYLPYKSH
jgi:lipopolysaccharide export system ATP-binding protein